MNKKRVFVYLLVIIVSLSSCCAVNKNESRDMRSLSRYFKERKLSKDLYNAVWGKQIDWLKEILAAGADPDFCIGECGWYDSNPLDVLSIESTYPYYGIIEPIPDPAPDVKTFQLLVNAGADVNKRPYVWRIVYFYDNDIVGRVERYRKQNNESLEREDINEQVRYFVSDVNRLLQCFLAAGADPDKLGHPYPFGIEAMEARIKDDQANEYFVQGTRAVNIAIEKGILWESQVDLLLQYTKLDEESLKAAERSNDTAMIEKIYTLWRKQEDTNISSIDGKHRGDTELEEKRQAQ